MNMQTTDTTVIETEITETTETTLDIRTDVKAGTNWLNDYISSGVKTGISYINPFSYF